MGGELGFFFRSFSFCPLKKRAAKFLKKPKIYSSAIETKKTESEEDRGSFVFEGGGKRKRKKKKNSVALARGGGRSGSSAPPPRRRRRRRRCCCRVALPRSRRRRRRRSCGRSPLLSGSGLGSLLSRCRHRRRRRRRRSRSSLAPPPRRRYPCDQLELLDLRGDFLPRGLPSPDCSFLVFGFSKRNNDERERVRGGVSLLLLLLLDSLRFHPSLSLSPLYSLFLRVASSEQSGSQAPEEREDPHCVSSFKREPMEGEGAGKAGR